MDVDDDEYDALVEIYKAVADACDGGFDRKDVKLIKKTYQENMPHLKDLYSRLILENNWVI